MLCGRLSVLRRAETHRAFARFRFGRCAAARLLCRSLHHDGRRPAAEALPRSQTRQSPVADPFAEIIEKVQQAAKAEEELKRHVPPGVFETVTPEQRGDPFGDPPSAAEAAFEKARARRVPNTEAEVERELEDAAAMTVTGQPAQKPKDFRNEFYSFPRLNLPTDPAQLKALPRGFYQMNDVEQQEELWIVQAEERLGREWEVADPGKHVAYSKDFPPYSPSKVIGMLLRWRNRAWSPQQWRLARAIACNRSLRPAVLTAQAFLRRQALLARRRDVELRIERYLGDTREWKSRLAELEEQTGLTEADIKQWLWILSPTNGDVQVQRFLRSECRKPLFLLQLLLARDKTFQEPGSLLELLQYLRENYVLAERPPDEASHPAYKNQGRSVTWWHFLSLLHRLVWHCREGWPAAMPMMARLTADYLGTMRLDSESRALTGYQARSLVLNKALRYMAWPARLRPFDHMEHNWAAQRHLLQLAATSEPPLVMDQNGYRAVRTVLIALSKSKSEARNADRTAKTWPPYRRALDGIDERRDPGDDLSRSAKAGMLVRAAGYSDDIVDRALNALGGSTFGQAPTIQTRSLPPPFFSGDRASQNVYSEWAAQIRATRNAREAWMMFENPPKPGIRPSSQIYREMFEKLFARQATDSPFVRPGDAKEVFPVHDDNLSKFEIARLTPPTPEELYDLMLIHDKLKPSGPCLETLVRNAPNKTTALRYLGDSPFGPYIQALRMPVTGVDVQSLQLLANLPVSLFNAWIEMLCRLHTRAPREQGVMTESLEQAEEAKNADAAATAGAKAEQDHRAGEVSRGGSIQEAIALASKFQAIHSRMAHHDRSPWHTIMRALAGPKILYSRLGAEYNLLETLVTFLKIYERTTAAKGFDPISFEALCILIRKTMKLTTFQMLDGRVMAPRSSIASVGTLEKMLLKAHRHAVQAFSLITASIPPEQARAEAERARRDADGEEGDDGGLASELRRYNVVGRPVYRYMLALACCGDRNEMVRLMDWLLDGWDREYIREEAKMSYHIDYHYTMRTIAYFAEMGRVLVEPAEMERLQQRLETMRLEKGCTWFWPEAGRDGDGEAQVLPELETDLALVDRWARLRQMVNFGDPGFEEAAELADVRPYLPVRMAGQESEDAPRPAGAAESV